MSRNSEEKPKKPASAADRRARRLAEALRANLKRRKLTGRADGAEAAGKPQVDEE